MTELCPEAINQGDFPPLCNLNNRKPCVDDPDLECAYFQGYLRDTLYADSRIGGQDD